MKDGPIARENQCDDIMILRTSFLKDVESNMSIRIVHGDILDYPADVLVLPCNGSGIMGFMSLAGEVRKFMGRDLYLTYRDLCPMKVGDVHLIDASPGANQRQVLLACTMEWPGTPIPVNYVTRTTESILTLAEQKSVSSLAWPLLGCGGGRLEARQSFRAMTDPIEEARERGYAPDITIVEKSPHKVKALQNDPEIAVWVS